MRAEETRRREEKTNLFLEVSNSVVIGVGEEVGDGRESFLDVILEMVHQMRSITLKEQGKQAGDGELELLPPFPFPALLPAQSSPKRTRS